MANNLNRPALIVVIGVLGFLVAISFNTTKQLTTAHPERASDLASVVRDLENQRTELQERLADLRGDMDVLEAEAAEDAGISDSYSRELDQARQAAGLSGVTGPGVEILLGDGGDVAVDGDPNDYLIHDTDITAVVNALVAAGAEAVEINGERVVATTPIRCAGTTVLVNSARLGSPYVIRAVGDPGELEAAVADDPIASLLFTSYKAQYGLQAEVTEAEDIVIEPYKGTFRPQYLLSGQGGQG